MKRSEFVLGGMVSLAALAIPSLATGNWQEESRVQDTQEIIDGVLEQADIDNARFNGPRVFGFGQFRWSYDSLGIAGFSVHKAVIGVEGEISDEWSYLISGQFTPDTSFEIRDAYVDGNFGQWGVRAGRFRLPFMAEWQVNEPDLLGNDYSILAYTFGQGRSEGVQVSYSFSEDVVAKFAYSDGFQTPNNAPFNNQDWGVVGRVEVSVDKNFIVGGALAYNSTENLGENFTWTLDSTIRFNSQLHAFVSYTGRSDDVSGDGWRVLAQGGYDIDEDGTIFAQYQFGDISGGRSQLSIASLGYTHMFNPSVRWTTQVGYSFNAIDASWNVAETGWNYTRSSGQSLLTSQLTISF